MDTVMIGVTAISLGMASVLALIVFKLLGEERRRSDARVAALVEMASEPASASRPVKAAAPMDLPLRPAPATARQRPAEMYAPLFEERVESTPWIRRFAVIGGMAAVLGLVVFGFARTHPSPASPVVERLDRETSLELMSLRHAQQGETLVITGLVQNPRGNAPLTHVVATAFVFGADGAVLASGRAPLDFTTLTPGEESPFVINVPVTGTVSKYRVGFRTEDGRVIGHVDRRADGAVTGKAGTP